jgi:hypothetical protein
VTATPCRLPVSPPDTSPPLETDTLMELHRWPSFPFTSHLFLSSPGPHKRHRRHAHHSPPLFCNLNHSLCAPAALPTKLFSLPSGSLRRQLPLGLLTARSCARSGPQGRTTMSPCHLSGHRPPWTKDAPGSRVIDLVHIIFNSKIIPLFS